MILAINIGNTTTTFGLFNKDRLFKVIHQSTGKRTLPVILTRLPVKGVIVSSVVPSLNKVLNKELKAHWGLLPLYVSSGLNLGLRLHYRTPEKLGSDRIANIVGGYQKYHYPLLIIDSGTATTFDILSKRGDYLGGVIAPGLPIFRNGLTKMTAQLPCVSLNWRKEVIGKDTRSCLLSGIKIGYQGMVEKIVERIETHLGYSPKIVLTGGGMKKVKFKFKALRVPFLTLFGLYYLYQQNK
jgi:type III pantothenate kinase